MKKTQPKEKSRLNCDQRFISRLWFIAFFIIGIFSSLFATAQPVIISTNTTINSSTTNFDGQDLIISNCTLTLSSGTHAFSSLVLSNSAQLLMTGGTIQTTTITGSTNDTSIIINAGTFNDVAINGILDVGKSYSGAFLIMTNGLTLNGTLLLGNPTNSNYGIMDFAGSQTLDGIGTILFGLNTSYHNTLFSDVIGTTVTIQNGVTIRGQNGTFGKTGFPANTQSIIVNSYGSIMADVVGGDIYIRAQTFYNHGNLIISGGNLHLNDLISNSGNIYAMGTNGGTLSTASGIIQGGIVGTNNGPSLVLDNSPTFDGVTVNGTIEVGKTTSGTLLLVTNGLTLNGTLVLGSPTNSNHGLVDFLGFQTLGGNGTVSFGAGTIYSDVIGTTLTIGAGISVHARTGTIGTSGGSGEQNITIINQGSIFADIIGGDFFIKAQPFYNQGSLILAGGNLHLNGQINNSGSIYSSSTNGGALSASAGIISGGTIGLSNGPTVLLSSSGLTFESVTVNGTLDLGKTFDGTQIWVTNGLTLNGALLLGSFTNSNRGYLTFRGPQTLGGNGTVSFGTGTIYSDLIGTTLTIGAGISVHARTGTIGTSGRFDEQNITIVNQGSISSDVIGGDFFIKAQPFNNQGNLILAGGNLHLNGQVNNSGGIYASSTNGGTLSASAGTISGGTVGLSNGPTVLLNGSLMFDHVTVYGTIQLNDWMGVTNGLTLNGTLFVGSQNDSTTSGALDFSGSQTLGGNGAVIFGYSVNNAIYSDTAGVTLTIGPGITIRGRNGNIGHNTYWSGAKDFSLINQGTISADIAGGTITIDVNPFTNLGTLAHPAGTLRIIDHAPPSSHVNSLAARTQSLQFPVSWSGQDDSWGSGVASYEVYASDNGGAWAIWKTGTLTNAVFQGTNLHSYAFKSVAHDNSGNTETQHASADALTLIDTSPLSLSAKVNGQQITLSWAQTDTNYHLLMRTDFDISSSWAAFTNGVIVTNSSNSVALPATNSSGFFRLQGP